MSNNNSELLYDESNPDGLDYHALNAKLNLLGPDGKLQLEADKEAVRQFFLQHVNQNTVFFHNLEEKIEFLIDNNYYEEDVIEQYTWDFVKSTFKRAYGYKYRFPTFMGAFKYYTSYTLKTFDGKRYLERYEDRVSMVALYLGRGDEKLATQVLDEIMTGRFQPATPTFLNAGKAQRGELVSCFAAGTPIDTINGQVAIESLSVGDRVLSHDGHYHRVEKVIVNKNDENMFSIKHYGHKEPIVSTPNHPILIWTNRTDATSMTDTDGADVENGFIWVEAQDVLPGDYVVATYPTDTHEIKTFDLLAHIDKSDKTIVDVDGVIKKKNIDKRTSRNVQEFSGSFVDVNRYVKEDYDLGLVFGWYLSEGFVSKRTINKTNLPNGVHFTLGKHEEAFQKQLIESIERVFGVQAKVNDSVHDLSTKISVHSRIVAGFILSVFGTGYNKKRIPYDVLTANHDFQLGLLHGLFRGDGHTTNGALSLDLVNPEMIDSIQLMLSRLGIVSRVRSYTNTAGNITGQVCVPGLAGANEEFIYTTAKNLKNYVGLRGGRKNFRNSDFYKFVNGRIVFEVSETKVIDDSPELVYNLEVENTHTYSVRGISVHNCFLLRTEDNMESISRNITNSLQLSKRGGGVALNLTNLREMGSPIKKIENQSSGVVPVMKMLEDSFSYANQLGARQGAGAVYLNAHHPDIMRFLDTKRENADEKIRIKTLSLGVVIPDITFELARNNEDMYLFSPYDVERVYGVPFDQISVTEKYREMVEDSRIRKTKIKARQLFQTIAEIQFESGYPYIMFEDTVNKANPIDGKVSMSNLCVSGDTEILTDSGFRTMDSLYASQENFDVIVDKRARDMSLANAGVSQEYSTRVFKTAENAEVFQVKTLEGFEIKATAWHKFYVDRDGEIVKIPLSEVEIGDRLLVQSGEGSFGNANEPALAYAMGALAADGTYASVVTSSGNDSNSTKLCLYGDKIELSDKIESAVSEALAGRSDLIERQATLTPKFSESVVYDRSVMSSAPLAKLLQEHGVNHDNKTDVPNFVLSGNKETQVAYLSGLFSLDGSIIARKAGGGSVELGSINRNSLVQVQKMLLNLGVYSRIYNGREEGTALLPDGNGSVKTYLQRAIWSLRVTTQSDFDTITALLSWRKPQKDKIAAVVSSRGNKAAYQTHKFRATVSSIEFYSVEDVYDVTVENGNSVIFNGIATGQCSEILQVSTPSTFNPDGTYKEIGKDISCNLGSLNIATTFDSPDFAKTIETAIRSLTAVSDLSNIESVPSIERGNKMSHAIGLGQMNLHGFLAREHIFYASPEAVDFTNLYFYAVLYQALVASNKIAKERGEVFEGFEKSKYATGEFFQKYIEKDWSVAETETVEKLMKRSSIFLPKPEDWVKLSKEIQEHGIYNQNLQAVPPTGSISYINNSTSSIHPITSAVEIRKEGKLGRIYYPAPYLSEDTLPYYADAYKVGPEAIIDVYAAATQHVDQGLSLTLFYPDTATTRDLNKSYVYAFKKGIKTLYYMRVRQVALDGTQVEGTAGEFCESCAL